VNHSKHADAIVSHYLAKGLRAKALRKAVERHGRLLQTLDPAVTRELHVASIRERKTRW